MKRFDGTVRGRAQAARGGALLALIAFAALDVFLITLAIHHARSRADNGVVAISTEVPGTTPTTTPSATTSTSLAAVVWTAGSNPVALSSYGQCGEGYATVDGRRVTGVATILAATGATGSIVGLDSNCKPHVLAYRSHAWTTVAGLTPPSGPAGASSGSLWVIGESGGLVVDAKGASQGHPKNPCLANTALHLKPAYVAASSTTVAETFCTTTATKAGQVRLVYGTNDGGKTWAEYSGARAVGPGAKGRKDGLDGDGRLVAAASLGGDNVGVLLADSGCSGLQLRTSKDRGRNWVVAGCLPDAVGASGVALGGDTSKVRIGAIVGGQLTTYTSNDHGKTWSAT